MNLIDRCLLSIGWHNELVMHQLLQKMGRFMVHQESPQKPWKRSRLWCHEESFKVLKQKKGTGNLLGLALDMRRLEKEKLHGSFELKTNAFSKMDNLILLQLNFVKISGSYENFPEELRWLCMHGFPLKFIPLDLPMENLVALDMSYSNIIESFDICYSYPQRLQKRQKLDGLCFKEKRGSEESEIQMYYEFGIFSTVYRGNEMPDWITDKRNGPSISFTIPSSPNKLKGLDFCYVYTLRIQEDKSLYTPVIIISNITKNRTWIYKHYVDSVNVGGDCLILLSHWMFGMNEMECGDEVTITVLPQPYEISNQVTKECGVRFVYDDGDMDEEEDALGYYKSWNHIIGGDLTGFQLTTGEYLLWMERFMYHDDELLTWDRHLVEDGSRFKGRYHYYALIYI
ncbi:hypothetical protein L2E82_29610 [Cichorium intybus]|uniref:Uncharacterized protein n=1 Tax=Cichorium intybus TaxID=13427 RepID=A0ACB9CYE6_CICIN|nr:hypothetical protein L2E82_29610 [Cichorium intybus]